jgi:hypothetical protein
MNMTKFKAGDAVTWTSYGATKRGTIVQDPNGSVAIIREHDTWKRTWANIASLRLVNA